MKELVLDLAGPNFQAMPRYFGLLSSELDDYYILSRIRIVGPKEQCSSSKK
jgi:hypothetical protein